MPRFAAHLARPAITGPARDSTLAAVAAAGFRGVALEIPHGPDLAMLKQALDKRSLGVVLIEGDRSGLAARPGHEAEFRNGLAMAIDHARRFACDRVSCRADEGLSATLVANLGYAGTMLAAAGLRLLVEMAAAPFEALCAAVGNPNLRLLAYAGDLKESPEDLERLLPLIGHIRTMEGPDSAESAAFFANLDLLNYAAWVGCDVPAIDLS